MLEHKEVPPKTKVHSRPEKNMRLKEKVYRALIKYWGSREEVSNSEMILSFAVLGSRTLYSLWEYAGVSCVFGIALERILDSNIKLSLLIMQVKRC